MCRRQFAAASVSNIIGVILTPVLDDPTATTKATVASSLLNAIGKIGVQICCPLSSPAQCARWLAGLCNATSCDHGMSTVGRIHVDPSIRPQRKAR